MRERGDTGTIPLKPGTNLVPCLEACVQNLSKASTVVQRYMDLRQAKNQAKTCKIQPAEGCNQGAIRVQLGCNQGAKGCNPKIIQKHAISRTNAQRRPIEEVSVFPKTCSETRLGLILVYPTRLVLQGPQTLTQG